MALVSVKESGAVIEYQQPKKRKIKEVILEEDKYVQTIEHIIKRDYFPALEPMQRLLAGGAPDDPNVLTSSRPRPPPSPERRSGSFEEPDTPLMDQDAAKRAKVSGANSNGASEGKSKMEDLRLNHFLAVYNSEDNESFGKLLHQDLIKKEAHNVVKREQLQDAQRLLILDGDEKRTGVLESWKFQYQNLLMFTGAESEREESPSTSSNVEAGRGPPKEISIENTRFPGGFFDKPKPEELEAAKAAVQSQVSASGTPMIGGYKLLRTPTPMVGGASGGESPFITWGAVVDTPLHLEQEDQSAAKKGPQFKVPETPSRDELLWKLDQKNIKRRTEAEKKDKQARAKTPAMSPQGTPKLSSAAQRLLARGAQHRLRSDSQLMASYQSPKLLSPSATPGTSKRLKSAQRTGGTPTLTPALQSQRSKR